ncbi:methyltransferase domain-containing protein [Propionivibrio sp.]|uniref:class I SAM-dependent methyltransferase n=1 Tax=Propionivibrio sp. TaxID=2212460 RepID=UPI002625B51C|nr:methyltransferase domain-containing protein [Propionivibrio sp.]
MRINSLTILNKKPVLEKNIFDFIVRQAKNKSVLNVGAAGGVNGYLPNNKEVWLHHLLSCVASDLVGVDIDKEGIAHATKHGVNIADENCETMDLKRQFETIILSDVIEHLDAPVTATNNLMRHLAPDGCLLITTPNPTAFNTMLRAFTGRLINVYYDHVTCFMPEHIQGICDRNGYCADGYLFFDHIDKGNPLTHCKSIIASIISRVNPRLATSFMAIVKHAK